MTLLTGIYKLQNWFSISSFSNLNEIENLKFEFFYSNVIVLHPWGLSLSVLKFLFWVYGLLTSWRQEGICNYILPKAIMAKYNQAAKKETIG